ncbi:carbohydrate ABC transporter permease [Angelakisella massiliensis]|uniref:carbohydrate ABC transporter permease n=1 Tax=Angelakisella massiliensis TaxID=1871018 RepID=UPI0008F8BFE9|nr:carbohydrate ABC transporter permease [Angelakisella massiliensis]
MTLSQKKRLELAVGDLCILLLSLIILIPLSMVLLGSFKTSREAMDMSLSLPAQWIWQNYVEVFIRGKLAKPFLNSMIFSVSTVVLNITITSMAAFYLSRVQSRMNSILNIFFTVGMISPLAMIPTIKVLQALSLNNTYLGVILIYTAMKIPFSIFLFVGFIKTVPKEMDEAAIIDGCNSVQLFFRIVLPLLVPVVVTDAFIVFMSVWNDINIPLYFLNSTEKWTMSLTVYNFFGQYSRDWNLVFANLIITSVPVVLMYMFGQKYIVKGLTAGAVKG